MVYNQFMKRIIDHEEMIPFLSDESKKMGSAEEIYFPQTAQEISRILNSLDIPKDEEEPDETDNAQ